MLAQFDSFGNFEIPQITLCNPDGRALGILSNLSDRQMNIRFNDLSDLSFTIQRGAEECRCPVYEQVEPFRYLLVEGIGYFVITDVSVSEEGNDTIKTVEASSCEYELNNIQLGYYEGTFRFYSGDDSDPKNSLLSDIMKRLPSWRLDTDHIPAAVAGRSRTFDTTDQTVYAFLMTELEEAYECLFEFDILNRVIRVYDRNSYDNRTGICLSTEDVLQGLTLRTKSDEIKTALLVKGGNKLDILSVNPLGTNLIYNFSYYATTEWMDAALIEKVKNWQAHVESLMSSADSAFQKQRAEISRLQGKKSEKEGEITRLKQELSNLQVQQSAIISDTASQEQKNANLAALHPQILAAKSALSTAESALASLQTQLNAENNKLLALQKQVRLESVFTPAEMEVLSRFIQQGAYTEENITKQDNMTYEEVQAQALELYQKAQNLLKTISTPRYEYSVEAASFVFQKEFAHLTSQLKSGCLIDVRLPKADRQEGDIASLLLLEMAVDYDGRALSLTFGNRYKLSDPSALFQDLVGGSIAKTASTVEYLRTTFDFKQQKDELDHLAELRDESINLTHNMVVNADNQVMVIDASGISGRREIIGEDGLPTGDYENEVLKITNNAIAFSTDDFESTETVLGKNLLPDGVTTPDGKNYLYGLNAKLLMGDLIIGEKLKVSGEIEGRLINAKGLTVNNGTTDTLRVDENGDVSLNVKSLSITGNQVATKGDVTNGLNGLQVGGRNLILNSGTEGLSTAAYEFAWKKLSEQLVEGQKYTLTICGHIDQQAKNDGKTLRGYVYPSDWKNAGYAEINTLTDSVVSTTFTAKAGEYHFQAYLYPDGGNRTGKATLKWCKLEKGTKATDWTPAPEDPIGGKNLLLNTGKMTTTSYWGCSKETGVASVALADTDRGKAIVFQRGADCTGWFFCGNSSLGSKGFKFAPGDNYTLSFWAKTNRTPCTLSQRFCDGNSTNQSIWFPSMELSTGWQKYTATATATAAGNTNFLYFTFDVNRFVYITDVKLEIGSKATDWTPAPEDRAYLVNTLSPTQADGMWLGSDGKLNITATQIKAGKLQSKDGSSYFDLENGKIVGKNAEMTGSFTAKSTSYNPGNKIGTSVSMAGFSNDLEGYAGIKFNDYTDALYGVLYGMSSNGESIIGFGMPKLSPIGFPAGFSITSDGLVQIFGYKAYFSQNLQCGYVDVNSNSGSSGNYYGTATVYFSPAFSKLPVPSLTVVTSDATRVAASIDSASGGLTANSMRIRVVRQGGTGTTRVFWTAIEPD